MERLLGQNGPMFRRAVVTLGIVGLLATGLMGLGQPASASVSSASVRWSLQRVDLGQPVVARVSGPKNFRASVDWGDGTKTAVRCGVKACMRSVTHVYARPGTFTALAKWSGGLLGTAQVVVSKTTGVGTDGAPAFAIEMLGLLNAERAKVGASPLALCAKLSSAATKFANLMAAQNYYNTEHIGPDGSRPQDRVIAEGYRWTQVGENQAAGQQSVAEVMAAWVQSPSHYSNIVDKGYSHVGFGHGFAEATDYGHYWVQDFGAGGTC